eukprot:5767825-Lingulodinium_polyedra.AAC.1
MVASSNGPPAPYPALEHICRVSSASQCLDKAVSRNLAVSCAAANKVLEASFLDIAHRNEGVPLLTGRSCDGAPMHVAQFKRSTLPSGNIVRA